MKTVVEDLICEKLKVLTRKELCYCLKDLYELYQSISVNEFDLLKLVNYIKQNVNIDCNNIELYFPLTEDKIDKCWDSWEQLKPSAKPDLTETYSVVGLFSYPIYQALIGDDKFNSMHWNGRKWLKEGEV